MHYACKEKHTLDNKTSIVVYSGSNIPALVIRCWCAEHRRAIRTDKHNQMPAIVASETYALCT